MRLARNVLGTVGFYDEMPAFFIVTIAILIFFASSLQAFANYGDRREDISHLEDVQEFLRSVRTSGLLTHQGQSGLFEAGKILRLNADNVTRRMNIPDAAFWRIVISDLGNYTLSFKTSVTDSYGEADPGTVVEYRGVLSSPVSIWVNDEEIHPGKLKVELWR